MSRSTLVAVVATLACSCDVVASSINEHSGWVEPAFSSVGSRIEQDDRRKPAVTTIVTAKDIENMGALSLSEVLSRVAGVHVTNRSQHNSRIFYTRGIASELGSQTLFMINGIPVNSPIRGNFQVIWGSFPIHAIEQIEVMRGPGSSLYGANALSGVINIKMKDPDSLESEIGFALAQNNTYNAWLNDKISFAGLKWFYSIEHQQSEGLSPKVKRDFQTQLDEQFDVMFEQGLIPYNPDDISLAPGRSDTSFKVSDIWLTGSHEFFDVSLGWQRRYNIGQGIGSLDALDPEGKLGAYRHLIQISGNRIALSKNTSISYDLAYVAEGQRVEGVLKLLPNGANLGAFPEGVLASPEFDESKASGEFSISHVINPNIDVVLGIGRAHEAIDDVNESKNFGHKLLPLASGYTDVSDIAELVNLPEISRDLSYAFFESLVTVQDDVDITLGARVDDYSDFGSVVSPRLSLVWMPSYSATVKLTYGKAFRAPSFSDLHSKNNPVVNGNPELTAERIDSVELSLELLPTNRTKVNMTLFTYELTDFLELTMHPDYPSKLKTENLGRFEGNGVEIEYNCDWNRFVDWQANITYVDISNTEENALSAKMAGAPMWQSYIGFNFSLSDNIGISVLSEYIGEREYVTDLGITNLDDYVTWDASLKYETQKYKVEFVGQNLNNAKGFVGTNINSYQGSDGIMQIATIGRVASMRFTYKL